MKLRRDMAVASSDDNDNRIFELAFSSEAPYAREIWDETNCEYITLNEVLSHEDGAVDLSRLNNSASLLFNHDFDQHIGRVISARIDPDKVGRAEVQFSKFGGLSNDVYRKVVEGTLSKVSVGYEILEYEIDHENAILNVTKWVPTEISIVAVPADDSVGINRSNGTLKIHLEEKRMSDNKRSEEELLQEIEQLKADLEAERAKREEAEHQPEEKEEEQQEQEQAPEEKQEETPEEFQRSEEEIEEMKEIAEHVGMEEELQEHIEDKAMDLERFKRFALNKYTRKSEKVNQKGKETMNMKEVNAHDAIRSILTGKELSAEAKQYHDAKVMNAERSGHEVRGTFIPVNALAQAQRQVRSSQNVASVASIQQTEVRYDSFVDLLMAESILGKLNINRLTGLTTPISIPRVKSVNDGVFGWVEEDGEAPESTATFDAVPMMPKQFVGGIPVSKLALQTTPGITGLVSDLLIRHASQKLEQCLFTNKAVGNGTNAPKGLVEAIEKSDVEFTYASFVKEIAKLTDKGVPASALRFVMRGEMASTLKTTLKDAGVSGYIIEDGMIAGVPVVESGNVDANSIYLGDFSAITVGEWGDLSLDLDDTSKRSSSQIICRVFASLDIAVTNPDAIVRLEKKSL